MKTAMNQKEAERAPSPSLSVLIVDDDEEFRNAHVRAINHIRSGGGVHMKAVSAADGSEALSLLRTQAIDCCLIDYRMPGPDGLELQKEILGRYPDMAVIVVTGNGSEDVAVRAIKEGAMDYLVKGAISVAHLEAAIVHSVNRARLAKALEMQRKQLVAAERQRVMLQSLGTACHHIAQPLTVLRSYITMLRRNEENPTHRAMIDEAFNACHDLCEIVWKISDTSSYRTEPYLKLEGKQSDGQPSDLVAL